MKLGHLGLKIAITVFAFIAEGYSQSPATPASSTQQLPTEAKKVEEKKADSPSKENHKASQKGQKKGDLIAKLDKEIEEVEALLKDEKKATPEVKDEATLSFENVKKLKGILSNYSSKNANYKSSLRLCFSELKSVKNLLSGQYKKNNFNQKSFDKLKQKYSEMNEKAAQFSGDQKLEFDTAMACAKSYIDFIEQHKDKDINYNRFTQNAYKYIKIAQRAAYGNNKTSTNSDQSKTSETKPQSPSVDNASKLASPHVPYHPAEAQPSKEPLAHSDKKEAK